MYMNHTNEYKLCRLCLCSGGRLLDIFEENTPDFMVEKTIEDLLQLKVAQETVFPWLVCHSCLEKLTEFRLFKLRCHECLFVFDNRVQKGDLHKAKEWESSQEKKGCKEEDDSDNVPCTNYNQGSTTHTQEGMSSDDNISSNVWENSISLETIAASDLPPKDEIETFIAEDAGMDPIGASTLEEMVIGKGCKEEDDSDNVPCTNYNQGSTTHTQEGMSSDDNISSNVWENSISLETIAASDLPPKDEIETFIAEDAGMDPIGASTLEEMVIGEVIKVENDEHIVHEVEIGTAQTDNGSIEITEHKVDTFNDVPNWTLEDVHESHKERNSKCPHCRRQFCTERGLSIHVNAKHRTESNNEAEVMGRVTDPFSESEVLEHRVVLKECQVVLTDILKNGTLDRNISMESTIEITSKTSDKVDIEAADENEGGELEYTLEKTLSNDKNIGSELISNGNQDSFSQKGALSDHTENHLMAEVANKSGSDSEGVPFEEGEIEIQSETLEGGKDLDKMSEISLSASQQCTSDGEISKTKCMLTREKLHSKTKDEKAVLHDERRQRDSIRHMGPEEHDYIAEGTTKESMNGLYCCNECMKSFTSKFNLYSHMLIHSVRKPHSCSVCSKSFTKMSRLKSHKLIHTGEKPHSCSVCSKSFNKMSNLKSHMLIHTGEKLHSCNICSKSFTYVSNLKIHMLIHSAEKPHSCSICMKSFIRISQLRNHMLLHSGERPHSCDICSKSFIYLRQLKIHMMIHSGEKPHSCSYCKKSFTRIDTLKAHLLIHSGEKPHSCGVCSKSFGRIGQLKSHMLTHSVVKPHSCSVCSKSFTQLQHLKNHMLIHSGEKPHSCGICEKSFTRIDHLKAHLLIHLVVKPHSCSVCSKSFAALQHLKNHMMVHSGDRPHSCGICKKSYTRVDHLKTHMFIHSGEKPHSCTVCSKSFARQGDLKCHMFIHLVEKSTDVVYAVSQSPK